MMSNTNRPTVLIVDDTPDNITLLSTLLKDKYNTKVATSGATALQIVASSKVDLILLDIMMPDVDGIETCRRLKADPASAAIPVVFLTAKSQQEDEALGRSVGAADFLRKPVNPDQLFTRVAAQLK
ncbi:response regulator [Duganella sp.]|uniref:response regulator n=1 Tax=Duganella sp. TaxID=1904440 RepID=UPI0031D13702